MPTKDGVDAANRRPPNLLVLGASGHVAKPSSGGWGRRAQFGRLVLLDRSEHVLKGRFFEHARLCYEFVRHQLRWPDDGGYGELMRWYDADVVLDLTGMDTLPVLAATEAGGVNLGAANV